MGSVSGRHGGGKLIVMTLGGLIICIALVVVALTLRPGEPEEIREEGKDAAKKSHPAWNLALGNVVIVPAELGFTVKGAKDASRVATKIESQLAPLREFYRAESETRPALMGGLLLELTLGTSGEVTQVKEISTRIANDEFRKAVIAAVKKWEFKDIDVEGATILCPLLFVREGMDITTLLKWEKNLGLFEDKHALGNVSARVPTAPPTAMPDPASSPSVEDNGSETPPEKRIAPARTRSAPNAKKPAGKTTASQVERAPRRTAPAEDSER